MSEVQSVSPPPSGSEGWRARLAVAVPLLLQVGAVAWLAWQALVPYWKARWAQDDAYISFRFARHLAQGHGLVYNVGERVEGYTNFLWTLLSAIPLARGATDPLPFMHTLSLALWLGSFFLLLGIGGLLYREGNWAAPLAAVPLLYHWSYNMWFFSGMETPLVSFLVVLTLLFFTLDPEKHPYSLFWTSLSAVALMLTRADGVVFLAALAAAGLVLHWRPLVRERRWVRYLVLPALPLLLVYVPYTMWRVSYYGSFFPNTYYAKAAYLTFYARGWQYLTTYFETYEFVAWTPLLVLGALVSGRGGSRRFLVGTLFATAASFWYVVRLGGDFMEWRFVTPVTGVLYPSLAIGAGELAQRLFSAAMRWRGRLGPWRRPALSPRAAKGVAGVIGWCAAGATVWSLALVTKGAEVRAQELIVPGQETIALLRRYCDPNQFDWGTVGKVLDEVLPQDVRIATTSAGIIPFFCDRPCLDLHGLTDPVIARQPIDPHDRGRMGHEHWLEDHDEMRRRGVDVLIAWADPKPYAIAATTPPQPDFELVSVRLPNDMFVEFVILDHAAVDVQKLRQDSRLVFYDESTRGRHEDFYALKDRFQEYDVVDQIDLEEETSQASHSFRETIPPDAPFGHNYHTKHLTYGGPLGALALADDGLRLWGQASFKVHRVRTGVPLVMILRHDQTGDASYEVEVNGQKVPGEIVLPPGPAMWAEASFEIPAEFLREGENTVLLSRVPTSATEAELYYLWFLQPRF